jgi:hypothetical protein
MLDFSHITDLRASLSSDRYYNILASRSRHALADIDVDYTISLCYLLRVLYGSTHIVE